MDGNQQWVSDAATGCKCLFAPLARPALTLRKNIARFLITALTGGGAIQFQFFGGILDVVGNHCMEFEKFCAAT